MNAFLVSLINLVMASRSLVLTATLCFALPMAAQSQAAALGGRFRDLRDPVVAAHALGSLAAMMCPHDRTGAAVLFEESLNRLRFLTPESFRQPNHLLPVLSFTSLWEFVTAAAAKCDPDLQRSNDWDRAR